MTADEVGLEAGENETLDDLLHGELKILQPKRGFRYSADALLLAHFSLPLVEGKRVLDMGCGAGVISLILARRGRPARVVGVELEPGLCELAEKNARFNPTEPPVEVMRADATRLDQLVPAAGFDLVVTNPPFRPSGSGQRSPDPQRAAARHELTMTLPAWLREAARVVGPAGSVCVVYPVDQEDRLTSTAGSAGLHVRRRQYAIDRPDGNRKLVLVEFRLEPGREELLADIPIETRKGKFGIDGYR